VLDPAQLVLVAQGMLALAPAAGRDRVVKLNENLIKLSNATVEQILQAANNGG
jgi:hypothetical protein